MIAALSCCMLCVTANFSKAQTSPEIQLEANVHDFGEVAQNSKTEAKIKVRNTGSAPLVITNAKGSCSCTVADYPKKPILPGTSGFVTVRYNSSRVGPINKTVTLHSNDPNNPVKVIRIKGIVRAQKQG